MTFQIRAQFPFSESFKNATAPGLSFGGYAPAFLTGGAGNKDGFNDPVGSGFLRLTNNYLEQKGIIWSNSYSFPSAFGMTISFEYYIHSGNGADGLAFILFDASANPVTSGSYGGSLGYAQADGRPGFSKGYLGIGLDEYGNFSATTENKVGGASLSLVPNAVGLRGKGSELSGYAYLTSVQTTGLARPFTIAGNDRTATDQSKPGFRKMEVVLKPRAGSGFNIDVYITHGSTRDLIINNYAYTTAPPPTLNIAITSSTGLLYNFHEIRNLNIDVEDTGLKSPIANPDSFSGCAGVTVFSGDIRANDNGTVNLYGTVNKTSIDLDPVMSGIQTSKTVAGKGTFTYDAVTGKVKFTPINNTVTGKVVINYTFMDTYGKLSNSSTITYTSVPKPADIVTTAVICSGATYKWLANDLNYSTAQSGVTIVSDNCTANQVLNLTVAQKPVPVVTNAKICSGETYNWLANKINYNTTQTGLTLFNDGCTADQVLNLTVGTKPDPIVTTKSICAGEKYIWSVNDVVYSKSTSITVENNGCTPDQVLNLIVHEILNAPFTQVNIKCKGESSGSVVITPNGGKAPYTIIPEQTNLKAGNYSFTVTDGNKCETKVNVTIKEPELLTAASSNLINVKCKGESNGSVLITPSGGTAPYSIIPEQTNLKAGNYSFTVTDDNKCETKVNVTIKEPELLTAASSNLINVKCKGEANGSVLITPKGGTAPYTIIPEQTNLKAGNYSFTVTDDNKCETKINVTITEPNLLEAKVLEPITPEYCTRDQDGAFSVEISGGTGPYKYHLDNEKKPFLQGGSLQTVFDFKNLSAGKHSVYIIDAMNCTARLEVILPDAVVLNPASHYTATCINNTPANSVKVTIDPSITNPGDVDYALDKEDGVYQSENIFTNVSSGNHIIYARHTNGCIQATKMFTVEKIDPLTLTIEDGELNQIVATATGGKGQYRYSFNEESNGMENKLIIYKSGIYTLTVTDQNGCTATASRYFAYIDVCIPNHFTPNGDGISDEWGPGCTVNYKHLTFTIFDRYGRIIGNYKYGQKWDGKYNGAELPSGDYWYVFKLNDKNDNREFVGHFNLYR